MSFEGILCHGMEYVSQDVEWAITGDVEGRSPRCGGGVDVGPGLVNCGAACESMDGAAWESMDDIHLHKLTTSPMLLINEMKLIKLKYTGSQSPVGDHHGYTWIAWHWPDFIIMSQSIKSE